jgi:alkylhydroperoxidase family enzyme
MSTVEPRIAYYKLAPDGIKHLHALERYLADCGLERSLIELVKLRASQAVRGHFNEAELVNLTLAITAINTWNRIAISFRSVPGIPRPPRPVA